MPRDKKTIHRATSDIEDEVISDEEQPLQIDKQINNTLENVKSLTNLKEERQKYLKSIILKRSLALKCQREQNLNRINSNQKNY